MVAAGGGFVYARGPRSAARVRRASPAPGQAPGGVPSLTRAQPGTRVLPLMELRAYTVLDSLQPQLVGFLQTVSSGFMPMEQQASVFLEIAPGIAINQLTDAALKATRCQPGLQIVERAYGMVELHDDDQGQVHAAGQAMLERMGVTEHDRLRPRVVSSQILTGLDGHQSQLINRMRHGDMLAAGQTLYILEVHPAAYAALAANEAEKAAPVRLLEVVTFGAFGRLWMGGGEAEIAEAARAAERAIGTLEGRDNPGAAR